MRNKRRKEVPYWKQEKLDGEKMPSNSDSCFHICRITYFNPDCENWIWSNSLAAVYFSLPYLYH